METVMSTIKDKMMIITLNNLVNCSVYNLMMLKKESLLTRNAMDGVSEDVKHRHIRHCYKSDPEYGKGVAKALEIDINDVDLEGTNDETYENF